MIPKPLYHILLLEDNEGDVRLVKEMLKDSSSFRFTMDTFEKLGDLLNYEKALEADVILTDLSLPDSHGIETLFALKKSLSNIALVVLTGLNDESIGIVALREGAQDYLVKDQINSVTLSRTIRYAVERKQMELEREQLMGKLQELLSQNNIMQGLLPMCSWCKKIRDDDGNWMRLEQYIHQNTAARVSHGICPECSEKLK